MSLISEIEKMMQDIGTSSNYRIVNLGGESVYVEGLKSVVSLDEEEIQLQLKKSILTFLGNSLKVKYLDPSTCVITGNIRVVEVR